MALVRTFLANGIRAFWKRRMAEAQYVVSVRNPRHLSLALAFYLISFALFGQPLPCGPVPDMTSTCANACVICDIDGYSGINDDTQTGQAPPGFCTGTVHHMQWIAFVAGSTNLTITVTPTNCQSGSGLEVGIYQSQDCQSFQLVSNCDGDIQEGEVGVFTNTIPLVIGQYYYFVMDGNMGDICRYLIQVTSGSTMVPSLATPELLQGPAVICQGSPATYGIPAVMGATEYAWTIDGVPAGKGSPVSITFLTPGLHELCVVAYNVCDTTAAACLTVNVLPGSTTDLAAGICIGDCLQLGDTTICDPGEYLIYLPNAAGCDSILHVTVVRQTFVENDLLASICSTDSLLVGDTWYHPPGQFDVILTAATGCDSIVHLSLASIECEISGQVIVTNPVCAGDSTGTLAFNVSNGTPPLLYRWERVGGGSSGNGMLPGVSLPVAISGLPAGTYAVTISDSFGNDLILTAALSDPTPLVVRLQPSIYSGVNISCAGGADGSIDASVSGGTPGYSYTWEDGSATPGRSGLSADRYAVTVTDRNGCATMAEVLLTEPSPLLVNAEFIDPGCEGPGTGKIEILHVDGGTGPYGFSLDGGPFVSAAEFKGLFAGWHALILRDANGCLADTSSLLVAAMIPVVDAGQDQTLPLGASVLLTGEVDISGATILWSPGDGLSCTDCLSPEAMPLTTTIYSIQATSADGCVAIDALTLTVIRSTSDIYIPNAITPNGDGVNDRFTVYAGRSVKRVRRLSVFSRWGELVAEMSDFMPNDPFVGWDGTFRRQPLSPGVFTWVAEVEFLDGERVRLSGDLSLLR